MVGMKPIFAPLPLSFWCEEEVGMQDETRTFDRSLFEYQTELWRPSDGRQIAFQTGSLVQARGGGPSLLLEGSPEEWMHTNLSPTLPSLLHRHGLHLQTGRDGLTTGSQMLV